MTMAISPKDDKEYSSLVEVEEIVVKKFRVILHNDDYTTFEFVTEILMSIFRKSFQEAKKLTMHIHLNGKGVAGVYTLEIAEMKVKLVLEAARKNNFPLRATIEENH